MPDLVAKIGADTSVYRSEMASLPPLTQRAFDQMRTASSGGMSDNLANLSKGLGAIRAFFVTDILVKSAKAFYGWAVEGAQASTKAHDEFAEAVLGVDKAVKSVGFNFKDFAKTVVGSFILIGENAKAGYEIFGSWVTGSQSAAVAMAATADGAREQELALRELKKSAAEWSALNGEQKSLIEARNEAERKALPLAEQRLVLEGKLAEAQHTQQEAAEHSLAGKRAVVDQMKIENKLLEINTQERAAAAKQVAQEAMDLEKQHQTILNGLEVSKKQKILKQEIADLEGLIASGVLSAVDADTQRTILAGRKNELLQTENQEHAKALDFNKRSALTTEETLELVKLLRKQAAGLTEEEDARLKILQLQSKEKLIQTQIGDLVEKLNTTGELTVEESKQLDILIKQDGTLKTQIGNLQNLLAASKDVTAEEGKKLTAAKEYAEQVERATKASHAGGDAGYMKLIGGLRQYDSPADQAAYEATVTRQASQDISDEIASLEALISRGLTSGSTSARYERQSLQDRVNALRNRQAHISDFIWKPNYSDAAGKGILAQQVETNGDPLGLQKKQVSSLDLITQNLADLNTRLRKAGFGT